MRRVGQSAEHSCPLVYSATDRVETCLPEGSERSSGSRVSRPTSNTLFIPMAPSIQPAAHRGESGRLAEEASQTPLSADYSSLIAWSPAGVADTGDRTRASAGRASPPVGAGA